MHAHLINIAYPGSFNTEVNKLLKMNGFEEMVFPDNPPSGDIMRITNLLPSGTQQAESDPFKLSEASAMVQSEFMITIGSLDLGRERRRMGRGERLETASIDSSREDLASLPELSRDPRLRNETTQGKPQRAKEFKKQSEAVAQDKPTFMECKYII